MAKPNTLLWHVFAWAYTVISVLIGIILVGLLSSVEEGRLIHMFVLDVDRNVVGLADFVVLHFAMPPGFAMLLAIAVAGAWLCRRHASGAGSHRAMGGYCVISYLYAIGSVLAGIRLSRPGGIALSEDLVLRPDAVMLYMCLAFAAVSFIPASVVLIVSSRGRNGGPVTSTVGVDGELPSN